MNENDETPIEKEQGAGEEPHIYDVKKDLSGWSFNRREFLAAAAATAAMATTGALSATGASDQETSKTAGEARGLVPLSVALPVIRVVKPGEPFTQVWQFTNNSDSTCCRGASLYLENSDAMQAPARIPLPDIPPGESVAVPVAMVAPAELGSYQGSWHLQVAGADYSGVPGQFTVLTTPISPPIESNHPYANGTNQTWTVTNPDTNAQATRVHFSRLEVEAGLDYIYLKDGSGQEIQRIMVSYPSGLWSELVPGQVVQVQLVTNSSVTAWGFSLDQVESLTVIYLPILSRYNTPTPAPTACHCDTVCTCDYVHYWYPN